MDYGVIVTTIRQVVDITEKANKASLYFQDNSLADMTRLTRVEPLTILSKDCINLEYMPDVMQSLLGIFSAYYLQAISVLTKINNVEVVRTLDSLNPNRDGSGLLLSQSLANENYNGVSLESMKFSLPTTRQISLEAVEPSEMVNQVANLAVGKLLNVEICYNKTTTKESKSTTKKDTDPEEIINRKEVSKGDGCVTIPVNVRLLASVIPKNSIINLLAGNLEDNSLEERYHAWRAGRISFIKDLIFCQDLIDEKKRALINDETGTTSEILRRVNNAKKFGLLTKNPSLVSASNLFVVTEDVAKDIEYKLGGSLTNPRIRQKAFESTYAMIIVVVDREWERVSFYTRGLSTHTNLSIKEIKSINKGKGIDIADVMKALSSGMAPSF